MKFYAWRYDDPDGSGIELTPREGPPPMLANDTPWVFLYAIEAATPEEANAIHSLRQGFGPYKPMGEPAECPECGAYYYPDGSGVCWRGHGSDPAQEDAGEDPPAGNP